MIESRAPYQEPVEQPCPICTTPFMPSGLFRGEFCSCCTAIALGLIATKTTLTRTYNDTFDAG